MSQPSSTVWLYYREATQLSLLVIQCFFLTSSKQKSQKDKNHWKNNKNTYIPQELYNSLGSNLYTEWFHGLIIKWHVSRPTFTMASIPPNSGTVQRRSRLTLPQLSGEALSGRRLGNPVGRMSRRGLPPLGVVRTPVECPRINGHLGLYIILLMGVVSPPFFVSFH